MNDKDLISDLKNLEILRLLQKDPRMPISALARQIGMSNPAAKERVVRLEESGIISGYRLELDPKELGYGVIAFVRIRPLPGHLPKIAELARQIPEVAECHRITTSLGIPQMTSKSEADSALASLRRLLGAPPISDLNVLSPEWISKASEIRAAIADGTGEGAERPTGGAQKPDDRATTVAVPY